MRIDPKGAVDLIRDPVHDYVPYTVSTGDAEASERDLLSSPWLQRLQRIHQMQAAWIVFPGATHARLLHAIGTMHLAGTYASALHQRYVDIFGAAEIPERHYVVELLRLAGLLHDLGHSAFGHSFERVFLRPRFDRTHREVGAEIVTRHLADMIRAIRRSPDGAFDRVIEPEAVLALLRPDAERETFWEKLFAKILHGPCSVDKLDYVVRDAYFCGTREYAAVDLPLLLHATTVTESGLAVRASAAGAFRSFLFQRLLMYENVYYHKTVRAFDLAFSELLAEALGLLGVGDPVADPTAVFDLDDHYVHTHLAGWHRATDPARRRIGEAWTALQNRRNPWKEAFRQAISYKDLFSFVVRPTTADDFERALRERLPPGVEIRVDMPYLDLREENPLSAEDRKSSLGVYDPVAGSVDVLGLQRWIRDLPVKYHALRVFARPAERARVGRIAREVAASFEFDRGAAAPA